MSNFEQVSAPESYPWHKVWLQVLFHPSVKTYAHILTDIDVKGWRAILWFIIPSLLVGLATAILDKFQSPEVLAIIPVITIIPFLGLTLGFHLFARILKGSGTYNQMLYACGAFTAPAYTIFWSFYFIGFQVFKISLDIWFFLIYFIPLMIYSIYQFIFAIQAVEDISTGKAFFSFLISSVIIILLGLVFGFFIMVLLFSGP